MNNSHTSEPERINIYGTNFSNINMSQAIDFIKSYPFEKPGYICFPSTNVISKAYKNKDFQHTLNRAVLTLPDGRITELYARIKGIKNMKTISGFWMMRELLQTNLTHYFYGSNERNLSILKEKIENGFPQAKILGYKAPPFISVNEIFPNSIISQDIQIINRLKPNIIWVGISHVKQDFLMCHYSKYLNQGLMIGVGAVFLYMTGVIKKGPEWIKRLGLRWLIRLLQEPRRLWRSTVPSGMFFIYLVCKELLRKKAE